MGKVAPEEGGESSASEEAPCWMFVGLGARGLLYHSYFAQLLVGAIASNDEGRLPPDVLRWKRQPDERPFEF